MLNDIGPVVQFEAITRIGTYLGKPMRWGSVDEAADYFLSISTSFGPHTREQWLALTRPMLKFAPDGSGWVVTHEDVTERRRTEAALRQSEQLLRSRRHELSCCGFWLKRRRR